MKNNKSLLLTAYSEAFVSVIPYILLMAIGILFSAFFEVFDLWTASFSKSVVQYSVKALSEFFSLILLIAISFQLAKRNDLNHLIVIFTSIAIFICSETLIHSSLGLTKILSIDSPILILIIPLSVVKLLPLITPDNQRYLNINGELNSAIKNTSSVIIIFTLVTFVIFTLNLSILHFFSNLNINLSLSDNTLLFIRTISEHILWFLGLNGSNLFDSILGAGYLSHPKFNGLNYKQFYDLFVIFGGSGAGLSLLLAVLLAGQDKQSKRIAKLAMPFVIFNINEILIFGIPIIFNRILFVPFLLVPVVNFIFAGTILTFYPIEFINVDVLPWITPALLNVFIATDGSLFALGLQVILISLGTLIYIPFVKKYTESQSYSFQSNSLINKLDIKTQLTSKQDLEGHKAKVAIIESNIEVEKFINLIDKANLMVYYQPKVDITTNSCNQYEALLRIKVDDVVKGPYFLPYLEEAGLAPIIDLWVCHQVDEHLELWRQSNFTPKISINLHPNTLANEDAILQIIGIFSGKNMDFEIIERGLLDDELSFKNIDLLKESGFSISIDDFGTGFSSFETLCTLPIDSLKIDKSLIDLILTPKGYIACDHVAKLSQAMGFTCVAEGVESSEQHKAVSKLKMSYIQGYCYSPAIPFEKVPEYSPHKP
ncbi:MAG: PTS sugar transporter subunit IIC/EAL domain-containing protein [Methylococcales bacterium]|nr:PTS sugar transporter subunit IIC/EAL domain-containing protein [Methylococcales bacterium]